MLIAGPLLVLAGVPLGLAGKAMWRNGCGPNSSTLECTGGTFSSLGMMVLAAGAYGSGIVLTGVGARRYANRTGAAVRRGGYVAGGAIVLPLGLAGIFIARALLWEPTIDCLEYSCVRRLQTDSTLIVGASALVSAAGAGMLMYGLGPKRPQRRSKVALLPRFGQGVAGLGLAGRF